MKFVTLSLSRLAKRVMEHGRKAVPVGKHFDECCNRRPTMSDVKILETSPNIQVLMALEALHIREKNPELNTRDEYRSRTLTYAL